MWEAGKELPSRFGTSRRILSPMVFVLSRNFAVTYTLFGYSGSICLIFNIFGSILFIFGIYHKIVVGKISTKQNGSFVNF